MIFIQINIGEYTNQAYSDNFDASAMTMFLFEGQYTIVVGGKKGNTGTGQELP